MRGPGAVDATLRAVIVLSAVVYAAWGLLYGQGPFADTRASHLFLALAAVLKLAFLLAGAVWAFGCRDRLEPGNPARRAWAFLSLGLLATLAGQLCFAPYQIVQAITPFPSPADLFFVLSYPFFILAFLAFLAAYRTAGLVAGSASGQAIVIVAVVVLAIAIAALVLGPILAADSPPLDKVLNLAYPVLDLVLLVPLALLLQIARRLAGRVGRVWALLLGGFVFLCVGDVLFAYLFALGQEHLDPFLHGTYIVSYGLAASAAHRQLTLLR